MKNLFLLLALMLCFVSCKDDKEEYETINGYAYIEGIVGNYNHAQPSKNEAVDAYIQKVQVLRHSDNDNAGTIITLPSVSEEIYWRTYWSKLDFNSQYEGDNQLIETYNKYKIDDFVPTKYLGGWYEEPALIEKNGDVNYYIRYIYY